MRQNRTKAKLESGEVAIGPIMGFCSPDVVEICALAGFDFVFFDGEHGQIGAAELVQLVRAAESAGITPLARVPHNAPDVILRFLDTGVQGVVVPQICSRSDAEAAVRAALFHPQGMRGLAGSRAARFGVSQPLAEYVREANREVLLIGLVEDVRGVQNLAEIVEVGGLDVIAIGASDLSQSLGLPAQLGAAPVQEAVATVARGVLGSSKVLAMNAADADGARRCLDMGARVIFTSLPALLARAGRDFLARVRTAGPAV